MLNRKELAGNRIRFEEFAASCSAPFVGQLLEVPMNAFGVTVARFKVVDVRTEGAMLVAEAEMAAP
jgi:hypothetical protein